MNDCHFKYGLGQHWPICVVSILFPQPLRKWTLSLEYDLHWQAELENPKGRGEISLPIMQIRLDNAILH
jgi:hypothetical protein